MAANHRRNSTSSWLGARAIEKACLIVSTKSRSLTASAIRVKSVAASFEKTKGLCVLAQTPLHCLSRSLPSGAIDVAQIHLLRPVVVMVEEPQNGVPAASSCSVPRLDLAVMLRGGGDALPRGLQVFAELSVPQRLEGEALQRGLRKQAQW